LSDVQHYSATSVSSVILRFLSAMGDETKKIKGTSHTSPLLKWSLA